MFCLYLFILVQLWTEAYRHVRRGERGIRGVMCYLLLLRARAAQCVTCAYHGHVAQHAPPLTPVPDNLEPSNYFSRLQVSLCLAMAICTYADAMHWRQALFMLMLRMVSCGGAVVPIF